MIVATIMSDEFRERKKQLRRAIDEGTPRALLDTGYELMRLSQQQVPHDEGTLQNSGTVEAEGSFVIVGYHTPYAARLHEHPEYRFQKGRKGKYLEDPLRENQDVLLNRFGISTLKAIEKGGL